jgi:hypothetical protein
MINTGGNLSKNIMDTLRNSNRLMGGTPGRKRQMAEERRDEQSVQKPIDNSHSHSKQESQNGALGAAAISAGAVPQQPNIMNQNFTNPDSQRIASGMFQGQDLENQMAQRRSTPTPVPGGSGDQDISPLMQTPYPHNNKYVYKPGDLMDESDQEESQFKSSNNPDKLISGKTYNVENVSDVQEDKKGQFMTTLDEGEHYGMEKRPTSSKVTNYDQGRNAVRDTLRPAQGNKFKSLWKQK